ncbi:hypothetical protein ASPSYDRAFT_41881 [Aspergillus sydowii CBS 593.65]|uniref:Methyltransferase domain-containing protein n=1 Tax=Aspergillus sydowii CBS 593.65 TaxID=1036612 RepID=A0A1L9TUU0_9EURO|nr:uncharacterized protein ASPSYDRAFT_41881 [Aspergillus sydowii CBS 593.65]OJJ63128.1 hypothetical protein ASPSYDRAFT_41881 [Aspergillus sydowii CBS 593.65]
MASQPASSTKIPLSPLKEGIRKAYNTISNTYSDWTKTHHATRIKYLNVLLEHLNSGAPTPQSVLELGCGSGNPVTALLASSQYPTNGANTSSSTPRFKVIGNDISQQQLNLASKTLGSFKNVDLKEGDMMDLSFTERSLDAVLGMYALIHLPREEQKVLLKRINTWLRPGGYFLGNFAVEEQESAFDHSWLGCGTDGGVMFWSSWGEEKTCEIFTEIGMEVVIREMVQDVEEGDDGGEKRVLFLWILGRKKQDI